MAQTVVDLVRQFSARPEGFQIKDVPANPGTVGSAIGRLKSLGQIYPAKLGHRSYRYFDSQARAEACLKAEPTFKIHARKRWDRDAPPVITPATKYTYAPPAPDRVLHTNTWPVW